MEKVIKMKVVKIYDGLYVIYKLTIIEQSYRKNGFGNPKQSFISSKGFELRSANMPARSSRSKLYVRGGNSNYDNTSINIKEPSLRGVMHAVREYNSHLIIADLPVIPKEASFIIE